MTSEANHKLANDFLDAIERGDLEAVQKVYAPDAVIWHNFDNLEQRVADNLKMLAWMLR